MEWLRSGFQCPSTSLSSAGLRLQAHHIPSFSLTGRAAKPLPLWWFSQMYSPAMSHQVDQWKGLLELWAVLLQVPCHRHKHKESSTGKPRAPQPGIPSLPALWWGITELQIQGSLVTRSHTVMRVWKRLVSFTSRQGEGLSKDRNIWGKESEEIGGKDRIR